MTPNTRKRFEEWKRQVDIPLTTGKWHEMCAEWGIAEGLRMAAAFEAGRCCPVCSAPDGFEISQRHFESLLAQEEEK